MRARGGVCFTFCNVSLPLSLDGTLFFCIIEWLGTLVFSVTEWKTILLCHLVVCCYVYPGLSLNCMQDLGVEEAHNWLDKLTEERNLTKR